jgi:hypothetical protein
MYRFPLLVAILCLGLCGACTPARADARQSPKEVVEQFYKLETEGRWLGPERQDELQDFLMDIGPLSGSQISVLRNYEVRDARKDVGAGGVVDYVVEVDLFEWGSIGPYFTFTKARGQSGENPVPGGPVETRTYESLVLRDTFIQRSTSSPDEEKKGKLGWRMSMFASPTITVPTAIRWVTEMRDKSNDPAIRYNAEKTLATLKSLLVGGSLPQRTERVAKESPEKLAQRFINVESSLLPEQWSQLISFFVETPKPQWDRAQIVDVAGTGVDTNEDSAEVEVGTNWLGELDTSMRLSHYPRRRLRPGGASACYGDYHIGFDLLLSDKQWQITPDGSTKELDVPLAWRIEDTSFEPLITLDTAIRYVRQMSEKSADPSVKRNGARTLSILNYYKEYKPLPDALSSDASGGCG